MAATRALKLLALLRAPDLVGAGEAPAGSGGSQATAAATSASDGGKRRFFTISNPPRKERFLAATPSQKYHPIVHGDEACEKELGPIESMEDCAAAATMLYPQGWGGPCNYPVWADNILPTDEPNEPYGCLALENPAHGCGLRWNPTGHEQKCTEPGLKCTVVCWEPDEAEQLKLASAGIGNNANVTVDEIATLVEGSEAALDSANVTVDEIATLVEGSKAELDNVSIASR